MLLYHRAKIFEGCYPCSEETGKPNVCKLHPNDYTAAQASTPGPMRQHMAQIGDNHPPILLAACIAWASPHLAHGAFSAARWSKDREYALLCDLLSTRGCSKSNGTNHSFNGSKTNVNQTRSNIRRASRANKANRANKASDQENSPALAQSRLPAAHRWA